MRKLERTFRRILEATSKTEPKDYKRKSKFDYINPEVVLEMMENGSTINQIAEIYGCNQKTVAYQMKKKGYEFDGRNYHNRRDILLEDVLIAHNHGKSIIDLAREYNTTEMTIISRLRMAGIQPASKTLPKPNEAETQTIINLANYGLSRAAITRESGYSGYLIEKVLSERGLKTKSHKRADLNHNEVINFYRNIMNIKATALKFGASRNTIEIILNKHGIKKPASEDLPQRRQDIPVDEIRELYKHVNNTRKIAEIYGCSPTTIANRLREAGVQLKEGQGNTRTDLPIKEIRKEYNHGVTISSLTRKYVCSRYLIKKIIQ